MTPHRLFPPKLLMTALVLLVTGCGSSLEALYEDDCAGRIDADECAAKMRWTPEWKESRTLLPPAPQEQDLVPIEAPRAQAGYDYFIDRKSLRLGRDGVMRYTVVARSPSGVQNAFHEGLRCYDDTVRTYGFASSDGVLREVASGQWHALADEGSRGYQDYLGTKIMCGPHGHAWQPEQAIDALTSQYTAGGVRIEFLCKEVDSCGPPFRHE